MKPVGALEEHDVPRHPATGVAEVLGHQDDERVERPIVIRSAPAHAPLLVYATE
jgi:hypothetical protein